MTLLSVRRDFIQQYSGRYDLVVDDVAFADAGADKFIRAGQRWLDRTFEIAKVESRYYTSVTLGTWYAIVPDCRAIHQVWMSDADRDKWPLTYRDLRQFRSEIPKDPALASNGVPLIYTWGSLRTMPEVSNQIKLDQFGATVYTAVGTHYNNLGVFWLSPVDGTYVLEINGSFYQPELTLDSSVNYWSEVEPHVLCMAAARAVEQTLRNNQGVLDWTNAIREELIGLEFDLADQESSGVPVMEG